MARIMGIENEIVRDVRVSRGLKLEAVAMGTGFSTSHIQRMETAESRVTIQYLRNLFSFTNDVRIPQLIVPELQGIAHCMTRREAGPKPPPREIRELLPIGIRAMKSLTTKLEYIERIVGDRIVDASDDTAIAAAVKESNDIRDQLQEIDRAILYWRDREAGKH